jgi:hypothetical protein
LSAGEIIELLSEEGVDVSVRTIERVLAEEGYSRLPRRTRLKLAMTVKGAQVPEVAQRIRLGDLSPAPFDSEAAGVFLFAPLIEKLNLVKVVEEAGLPGTKAIPAFSYFLSWPSSFSAPSATPISQSTPLIQDRDSLLSSMCSPSARPFPPTPTASTGFTCCVCSRALSSRLPGWGSMMARSSTWTSTPFLTLEKNPSWRSIGLGHGAKE